MNSIKENAIIIILVIILVALTTVKAFVRCRKQPPPIDYQKTIDSLKIEIAIRESQINDQLFVIEDLEKSKSKVQILHTKTITKYKTIPTPQRVQQLADRL